MRNFLSFNKCNKYCNNKEDKIIISVKTAKASLQLSYSKSLGKPKKRKRLLKILNINLKGNSFIFLIAAFF